ncbi:hypothetical protein [Desmospora profundinema]|uniref:DNA-binding MarR family transcriptional regulator n=1 Tax=Desmospora profundinema TaxID=1571184 RepID=A0ABU1IMX0_9BACL|nr:hypothetical protein [Desmospora profundinema]MDR6226125.1 DNA-binding MarR family transcriptional regulator [Desmospora profundinema]
MSAWYGPRGSEALAVSPRSLQLVECYLDEVVGSKQATKAEIKLMGYLVRRYLGLGETKKQPGRIAVKDWTTEAGLSQSEVDKALDKCVARGWIVVDEGTRPVSIRVTLHSQQD